MGCSVTKSGRPAQPCIMESAVERCSSDNDGRCCNAERPLTIVHFNDVYNIEEREKEPVGGAARFKTRLDCLCELHPLVLFSGDALSPSSISIVTEGRHMVPILNSFGVKAAVYGNHEFDFGIEHLVSIAKETAFPWLLSNVRERSSGRLLAEGLETLVLQWEGRKIGILGLVEWEWLVTLATIEPEEMEFIDYVTAAKRLLPKLKEEGCDLLVALTHMRMPNDVRLAKEVPDLHLILGGHDHHYEKKEVGDVLILKSGSDFREFSQITVTFNPGMRPSLQVVKHCITGALAPDPELQAVVEHYQGEVEANMQEEIGWVDCDLDGRFSCIRTGETNLGNLITDIMRKATRTDVALLNSGTLRSNAVHDAGMFKMKDLLAILPMVDSLTVLEVTGAQLLDALENGVSQHPKHEGRFPQVSGMSFSFDPSQPCGSRVLADSVMVGGDKLDRTGCYRLCTKAYIAMGKDGYDVFRDAKVVVSYEEGPILSAIVRNHFHRCSRPSEGTDGSSRNIATTDGRINPQVEGRIVLSSSG